MIELEGFWPFCLSELEMGVHPDDFFTYLQSIHTKIDGNALVLLAPNKFVLDKIQSNYLAKIRQILNDCNQEWSVSLLIGSHEEKEVEEFTPNRPVDNFVDKQEEKTTFLEKNGSLNSLKIENNVNETFTFESFVKAKTNAFALAASIQVAENPGTSYNPLLIYGGVGLGKTHLLHAIANRVLVSRPCCKFLCLSSERFVGIMVKSLQSNLMDQFSFCCRESEFLLIDDIQFFANKEKSQEELFHTLNSMVEEKKQIVLTCDLHPKGITGFKERLKSRFSWGLMVAVEPPDLETRAAILINKAAFWGFEISQEVAFFIARKVNTNIRELEGALKRVIASSRFRHAEITVPFVCESLRDLFSAQQNVTIDIIKKVVAKYYNIKESDLNSQRRNKALSSARQIAMALSREITGSSLPEIGRNFGGKNHTTVLHACRSIEHRRLYELEVKEDFEELHRIIARWEFSSQELA